MGCDKKSCQARPNRLTLLQFGILLASGMFFSSNIMEIVFAMKEPEYVCRIGDHSGVNETIEEQVAVLDLEELALLSPAIKDQDGLAKPDVCKVYNDSSYKSLLMLLDTQEELKHWINIPSNASLDWNQIKQWQGKTMNGTGDIKPCTHWVYNEEQVSQTLVSKFNLVCGRAWLKGLTKSIQLMGQLFGVLAGGALCDRFGRRPVARYSLVTSIIVRTAMSFSPALEMYLVTRFISGACDLLFFTTCYVFITEMMTTKGSALAVAVNSSGFTIGSMLSPLIGFLLPNWVHMSLANTFINGLLCLPVFCLPESPEWLSCVGRRQEYDASLKWMARMSGRETQPSEISFVNDDRKSVTTSKKKEGFFFFMRSPLIAFRLTITIYLWFTVSMAYYGLSLNVGTLAGNIYINTFVMSVMDLPSSWIIVPFVNSCFGRRMTYFIFSFLAAITLLSDMAFDRTNIARTVLAMIGKMALNFNFNTLYIYTTEMFPTSMRATSMGAASAFARVGSAISPFIALCSGHTPAVIFGTAATVATLSVLALPETRGKPFPVTLADVRKQKAFPCHCLKKGDDNEKNYQQDNNQI